MKLTITEHNNIEVDLSEYSQEVVNYVFDQLPDRMDELTDLIEGVKTNYETRKANFRSAIIDLIDKILDEKLRDIDYERRHGERE